MAKDLIDMAVDELSLERKLFHSEDDFKFSLGWILKKRHLNAQLPRFEVPSFYSKGRLDLLFKYKGKRHAIELKYKKRELNDGEPFTFDKERYLIRSSRAPDLGRYDFFSDISRLESKVKEERNVVGHAIFLTNEYLFWKSHSKTTKDVQFHIDDKGEIESGIHKWDGPSPNQERDRPIKIKNTYPISWRFYVELENERFGLFRYLHIRVT